MKFLKWLILVVGMLFFAGGYIAAFENNRLLVGDIYFSITDAKVVSDTGEQLEHSNLKVGKQVKIEFDGMVAESYPAQAGADKVIVMTKDDSTKAEEAVRAIVQFAEKQYGKPIIILNSDFLDNSHFRLEIRVFPEEEPLHFQYNYDTKNISLE
ncbi:DUF3221 domain-containing protein [Pseudoneobacillus rhizosphaerae]|uniref:DUF3221 domain-containing protein n=1 Tax=Pseudoneobacillus rhizosphaerae TaxID=2880968 RepID=A0A9C7GE89_9BACI|nr:DUF3221 domain-containing protein [Pseudoneobacillus rhizosphaerae]CAG9610567.1 hypothetical protein NEOCIP111885_04342 [Pseudoneobacillus rhizosphaerae]